MLNLCVIFKIEDRNLLISLFHDDSGVLSALWGRTRSAYSVKGASESMELLYSSIKSTSSSDDSGSSGPRGSGL